MTATVESWNEETGRGTALTTWPAKGRRVLLLRSEFRGRALRLGREKVNLTPGDSIQFVALRAGGIARRISRSQFTEDRPVHAYQRPEGPPRTVRVMVPPTDPEEAAYYHGEDVEEP